MNRYKLGRLDRINAILTGWPLERRDMSAPGQTSRTERILRLRCDSLRLNLPVPLGDVTKNYLAIQNESGQALRTNASPSRVNGAYQPNSSLAVGHNRRNAGQ